MGTFQVMIGGIISIVFYSVVLGGLYKIFQISSELGEIKEVLKDIRRNTEDVSPAALSARQASPEHLMRAVTAASYEDLVRPEVEPRTVD
jgi:hypothetical protein